MSKNQKYSPDRPNHQKIFTGQVRESEIITGKVHRPSLTELIQNVKYYHLKIPIMG